MLHEVDDKAGLPKSVYAALKPDGASLPVEPKVHTSGGLFGEEIDLCRGAGLRLESGPRVGISRAALFERGSVEVGRLSPHLPS